VLLLAFVRCKLYCETGQVAWAFSMFRSDYNVLRSTVIGLNNFIQYRYCQVV